MSQSAVADRPNTVSIKDAGPCAKLMAIEIPAETIAGKLRESLDMLGTEAQLPGFRKGRVPKALIEKRFGPSIRKEAKTELVTQAVNQAVEEHKLKVVGAPTAQGLDKAELIDGKPFAFEVEVEVLPEFDLPPIDGIAVKKPTIDVTDAMVDDELRKLCINEGSLESRDVAEPGDYITGHAVMVDDKGTEFYNLKGAVIQKPLAEAKGKGMILGIMVDDFDKQLGAPKPGTTITVKAKGPEQHEVEGIRGANLTITFQAERVDRIIPAPTADIVAQYGFESEAQLKDRIRARIEERVKSEQLTVMHQQIAKHLLDKTTFELPRRLSAQQAARTLARRRMELMHRGVDAQKIEENLAALRSASAADASRDLKAFFILFRIAEDLKIQVQDVEISQRIAQMAFQRNVRPEALRAELQQSGQLSQVYQTIREQKTLDALLNKATISEMPAEEFNKLMKDQAGKN
ncbi:MAG: trigger factor [Phycisphaerae bacterium]|nr:MAG: trigger factor [Phycisphaerae bacterium]